MDMHSQVVNGRHWARAARRIASGWHNRSAWPAAAVYAERAELASAQLNFAQRHNDADLADLAHAAAHEAYAAARAIQLGQTPRPLTIDLIPAHPRVCLVAHRMAVRGVQRAQPIAAGDS